MDPLARTPRLDWTMVAFAVSLAYTIFLVAMFGDHHWLLDGSGRPIATDFIDVFAAGRMAGAGHAPSVYDWQAHHAAELAIAGKKFYGYFGWHYPPPFLFAAVPLSRLPYAAAFLLWSAGTLPIYAIAIACIARRREALLWACAFPAVLLNVWVGQNGFVTAGLIGAALLFLEKRPILSGICIGLLTYKPQFGILFPFVLVAAGQWRALASATVTAVCLFAVSCLTFDATTWIAFLHSVPHTTQALLAGGHAGWNKLQTAYGFARWIGGSGGAAWLVQIALSLVVALGAAFAWRHRPFALKAAAVACGTLLATPYAYAYDFPILAIAVAFLFRHAAFDRHESFVLVIATLLIFAFPWAPAPLGFASSLLVASLVARRVWDGVSSRSPETLPQPA